MKNNSRLFRFLLIAFIVISLSSLVYAAVAKWIFVPNAASKTLSLLIRKGHGHRPLRDWADGLARMSYT